MPTYMLCILDSPAVFFPLLNDAVKHFIRLAVEIQPWKMEQSIMRNAVPSAFFSRLSSPPSSHSFVRFISWIGQQHFATITPCFSVYQVRIFLLQTRRFADLSIHRSSSSLYRPPPTIFFFFQLAPRLYFFFFQLLFMPPQLRISLFRFVSLLFTRVVQFIVFVVVVVSWTSHLDVVGTRILWSVCL